MTEQLHFLSVFFYTFFLSIIPFAEGTGNPFQCSCLENPKDRGAWWAAVYGVAKSQATNTYTYIRYKNRFFLF